MLKTGTSKPPQQQKQHNPKRQSTQAGGSAVFTGRQADRQTEPECQRSLPSPPAPCVFVCSSSSGGGGGARCWSSPTTRSVGRSAVAERAPNARIIHSTGGAVRVAHDSRRCAEVWLFAFETTSLAAVRLAWLDRRHLAAGAVSRYTFLSLRKPPLPLRLENIRGRGQAQPARTAHHSVFAHSILHRTHEAG